MRQVYLAATGQNRGKTTAALGCLDGFFREGLAPGFMKPVGQRTVIQDGVAADEDAVLMKAVFGLPDRLGAMSPVHIPRGFTKSYIAGEVVEDLGARIRDAHATFADRSHHLPRWVGTDLCDRLRAGEHDVGVALHDVLDGDRGARSRNGVVDVVAARDVQQLRDEAAAA